DLEAARYAADRALRQYDAADPANRLVTGELEVRWNKALARVAEVEAKIAAHDAAAVPSTVNPASSATLAVDLMSVWTDPSWSARACRAWAADAGSSAPRVARYARPACH